MNTLCIRYLQTLKSVGLALPLLLCALAEPALAQGIERTTELTFNTRNQSLTAQDGEVVREVELRFDILDEQYELQKGRIENSQVPLSVATLQAIWQRAIDTCQAQGYTVPIVGTRISPSQTECINGELRRNYCRVPPVMGWSACPNIGSNRRTLVVDLGPGIGPRPTQPARRPYDFGAVITMTSDSRLGFEGGYRYDLGSVDIDYSASANLIVDKAVASPGETVTVSTSASSRDPYLMNSRYPSFELALDMYAYASMAISAEYAGVNEADGNQVRRSLELHGIDSRTNEDTDENGFMLFSDGSERLFGVRLDSQGITTTILGAETTLDGRYEYNLTFPFNSPESPDKKAPRYQYPLSFSLADFAFTLPQLDTPAVPGFLCGDCVPRRNEVSNGTLTNTTPVGNRTLIGGITDGNGIVLPFVNEGNQDVDLARVDIDLDAITVAAGAPLGAIVADPIGVFEAELNLMDLDLATFISADQTLSFTPNLEVGLRFSVPTEVRLAGETDFSVVTSTRIRVGESLEFIQPETDVVITPIYSVSNNDFVNDTQLKVSNAIQQTLGQVKLGGYVGDNLADVLGEDPNFALLQITPTLYEPATIWGSNTTPWSLDGFVDQPGLPVTISLPGSSGGGGSGSGGGGGSGSGGGSGGGQSGGGNGGASGGSGGGGGGSIGWLLLAGMIGATRRRRGQRN